MKRVTAAPNILREVNRLSKAELRQFLSIAYFALPPDTTADNHYQITGKTVWLGGFRMKNLRGRFIQGVNNVSYSVYSHKRIISVRKVQDAIVKRAAEAYKQRLLQEKKEEAIGIRDPRDL